jgi:hypothetical protein
MRSTRMPLHDPNARAVYCTPLAGRAMYREAVATFTHDLAAWTHFCTLTLRGRVSDAHADAVLRRWARQIARDVARTHIRIAWAFGHQGNGSPHFHVLLALPPQLRPAGGTCKTLMALWRWADRKAGFVHVERYRRNGGAPRYMAHHDDVSWATVCSRPPRCRRRGRGCQETSCPL